MSRRLSEPTDPRCGRAGARASAEPAAALVSAFPIYGLSRPLPPSADEPAADEPAAGAHGSHGLSRPREPPLMSSAKAPARRRRVHADEPSRCEAG